jgi:hypothetical protein
MAENSENKNSPVRLPDELRRALWKETEPYRQRGEKPPTFGELLLKAWRAFRSHPDKKSSEIATEESPKIGTTGIAEPVEYPVSLTQGPEEEHWTRKFLYILRHGDPETIEAITKNVDRFSFLTRLLNREPEANDELDRIARQIATDPKRRVEYFRGLDQRYPPGDKGAGADEKRVSQKRTGNSPKTGTRGEH